MFIIETSKRDTHRREVGLTADQKAKGSEDIRAFMWRLDVLQKLNRRERLQLCAADRLQAMRDAGELGYTARSSSDERFRVTRRASNRGDGCNPSVIAAIRAQ